MKCPKCGKEIDANSKFCEYCGTQIKKNRKPLFITIAIVACLLILGGIGLTQYNKGEQERTRLERELSMYKLKAEEAESKANAEHEARLKAEAELRLEREAGLKAERKRQEAYARTYGDNGHEYVDLGLPSGLKWATCNIGASSPEEYGDCTNSGPIIREYEYTAEERKYIYDNVYLEAWDWGGTWRIPVKADLQELVDKCLWEWTKQNDVDGYKITGPNGNSIFLPAAGQVDECSGERIYVGSGFYWSSTCYYDTSNGIHCAYHLSFNSDRHYVGPTFHRDYLSVRLVSE